MNLGGMAFMAALMRRVKPSKKCERCGLRYPLKAEKCPHCAHLDAAGLQRFKADLEHQHRKTASAGKILLWVAALCATMLIAFIVRSFP